MQNMLRIKLIIRNTFSITCRWQWRQVFGYPTSIGFRRGRRGLHYLRWSVKYLFSTSDIYHMLLSYKKLGNLLIFIELIGGRWRLCSPNISLSQSGQHALPLGRNTLPTFAHVIYVSQSGHPHGLPLRPLTWPLTLASQLGLSHGF